MDVKGAGQATAVDVATTLLGELSVVKGTTSWQRKLASCVSQVRSTLKRISSNKISGALTNRVLQLHMVLNKTLAIVVQHGTFESKFLHAQWDREISVALRQLWKFHIELLLALRLQEEVCGQLPDAMRVGTLPAGSDIDALSSDIESLELDAESSDGSFPDFMKIASQLS